MINKRKEGIKHVQSAINIAHPARVLHPSPSKKEM
jgi:hypothetical protein